MCTDIEALITRLEQLFEDMTPGRHTALQAADALRSHAERIKVLEAKCAELDVEWDAISMLTAVVMSVGGKVCVTTDALHDLPQLEMTRIPNHDGSITFVAAQAESKERV